MENYWVLERDLPHPPLGEKRDVDNNVVQDPGEWDYPSIATGNKRAVRPLPDVEESLRERRHKQQRQKQLNEMQEIEREKTGLHPVLLPLHLSFHKMDKVSFVVALLPNLSAVLRKFMQLRGVLRSRKVYDYNLWVFGAPALRCFPVFK